MPKPRPEGARSPKNGTAVSSKKNQSLVAESDLHVQSQSVLMPLPSIPSSRIGLWKYHPASNMISWSPNSIRIFGLKSFAGLPKTSEQLVGSLHEDDQEKFNAAISIALRTKSELLTEARLKTLDGSYRWIEFSAEIDGAGKSVLLNGVIQDITIKKDTEFELYDWKTRNELVSESAGLLIYDYDVITGEIMWSGNAMQLVGFSSIEMGRIEIWEQLIHPDDRAEANRLLDEAKNQLKPYNVYYRFKRKDNGYCHMHDRGQFVTNNDGMAVRMLGIMGDVSERVAADRTIKQSEKSFRELFNSVGEAICIQRLDGTFVDVNKGTCDLYGYTKEQLVGKNPGFLAAPGKNKFDELRLKMEEALQGKPQSFQWWGRKKNAEPFILEVKLTRGTYFGDDIIISTSRDITEKIKAEQSLLESEKRFRTLIGDLNVGVILQGSDGDIKVVNKAALRLFGVGENYLLEKSLRYPEWNFITEECGSLSEEDHPWNLAGASKVAVRGVVIGIIRPYDKRLVWALVNAEPILREDSSHRHTVITMTDISERRKVEEDLKESELRFRTLQEASFGGIGLHNNGRIVDCNQGLCDITGFTHEELIGSNGLNLIAPEYRDLVYQKIVNKAEQPYDVQGVRKDGTRYYLEIHGKNIPYQEGLIRVTEFRDITDRKAAESKILEQNAKLISITEDLKVKNEQLQEFTQIVSHNLRSPVGNMLSLLNFIEHSESDEERGEYITLLKEAGTTTLTTLHELNDVLQIKQNKHIEKQKLEFEHVFTNVRRMLVAKIVECNAEIRTDFSGATSIDYPNIYLESILLNLLSNALKYHDSERKPVIELKTAKAGGNISLTVTDNGQGINMRRYGHQIFKLRKTFHKHPESRGIGLFMIRNQIDAMGGDISVSSVENEGTTFLINFNGKIREDEY